MIIQPKSDKPRLRSYSALLEVIDERVRRIAAINDASRSYVIATLLCKQLNIHPQVGYDEVTTRNQRRNSKNRRNKKVRRIK